MATEKQIAANRANAQKSTGPRTAEGRSISRLNAVRHGLTGHLDVMTAEEKEAHDTFVAGIADELIPIGMLERQLANSIAEGYWRINRVATIENNLYAAAAWRPQAENAQPVGNADSVAESAADSAVEAALASARTFLRHSDRFHLLAIYETRLHRRIKSDLDQLREFQSTRRAAEEKAAAEELSVERQVLKESCNLLHLQLKNQEDVDLTGNFTHPNGSVFSIPELLERLAVNRRLKRADDVVLRYPLNAEQLETFLAAALAAEENQILN